MSLVVYLLNIGADNGIIAGGFLYQKSEIRLAYPIIIIDKAYKSPFSLPETYIAGVAHAGHFGR